MRVRNAPSLVIVDFKEIIMPVIREIRLNLTPNEMLRPLQSHTDIPVYGIKINITGPEL